MSPLGFVVVLDGVGCVGGALRRSSLGKQWKGGGSETQDKQETLHGGSIYRDPQEALQASIPKKQILRLRLSHKPRQTPLGMTTLRRIPGLKIETLRLRSGQALGHPLSLLPPRSRLPQEPRGIDGQCAAGGNQCGQHAEKRHGERTPTNTSGSYGRFGRGCAVRAHRAGAGSAHSAC